MGYIYIYIYPSYLNGRGGHKELPQISTEYRFNQNHIKSWAKNQSRPLTSEDRVNFVPLTESNPTDNLGSVNVSQQIDAEMCD